MSTPTRVGGTIVRPYQPWTPAVHALLEHLHASGFTAAPRPLGMDEQGREVLTYVPGVDGRVARCYADADLARVAHMIRDFHDAAADFIAPPWARWHPDPAAPPGNLVCHNDLGPANTIYAGGVPRAFIDWDLAVPSTAEWDLSYAVRTFVPLYPDAVCSRFGYGTEPRGRRLRLFCDAYRLGDRSSLIPLVERRLAHESTGFAARCLAFVRAHRREWENAIG